MDYTALRRALLEEDDGGDFIVSGPLAKVAACSVHGGDKSPAEKKRYLADMSAKNHRAAMIMAKAEEMATTKKTASDMEKEAVIKELKAMLSKRLASAKAFNAKSVSKAKMLNRRVDLATRRQPSFA